MKRIEVSDHALVRYLERACDLDLDRVRNDIVPLDVQVAALVCGDGRYPIGNQFIAVIKNFTVVTVLDANPERREK